MPSFKLPGILGQVYVSVRTVPQLITVQGFW